MWIAIISVNFAITLALAVGLHLTSRHVEQLKHEVNGATLSRLGMRRPTLKPTTSSLSYGSGPGTGSFASISGSIPATTLNGSTASNPSEWGKSRDATKRRANRVAWNLPVNIKEAETKDLKVDGTATMRKPANTDDFDTVNEILQFHANAPSNARIGLPWADINGSSDDFQERRASMFGTRRPSFGFSAQPTRPETAKSNDDGVTSIATTDTVLGDPVSPRSPAPSEAPSGSNRSSRLFEDEELDLPMFMGRQRTSFINQSDPPSPRASLVVLPEGSSMDVQQGEVDSLVSTLSSFQGVLRRNDSASHEAAGSHVLTSGKTGLAGITEESPRVASDAGPESVAQRTPEASSLGLGTPVVINFSPSVVTSDFLEETSLQPAERADSVSPAHRQRDSGYRQVAVDAGAVLLDMLTATDGTTAEADDDDA